MQRFVFYFAYPFLWLIAHLPDRLLYGLSDGICFLIYRLIGYRKKVVRRNLCLAFPDKDNGVIAGANAAAYDLYQQRTYRGFLSQGTERYHHVWAL